MQYEIEIRSLATIETLEAYDWYEQQREGLGLKFLNELEKFYSILLHNPNTHSYYQRPVRQGKKTGFLLRLFMKYLKQELLYTVFLWVSKTPSKKELHKNFFR
jgi:hypothetical protein